METRKLLSFIFLLIFVITIGFVGADTDTYINKNKTFVPSESSEDLNKSFSEVVKESYTEGLGDVPSWTKYLFFILFAGLWVYFSFAWMTISRKLKQKNPGLMWIPVVRHVRILQLRGFHWSFIFLVLPLFLSFLFLVFEARVLAIVFLILGMLCFFALLILLIISKWKIFEKRGYSGWLILIPAGISFFIPFIGEYLASLAGAIIIGIVAWKDKE